MAKKFALADLQKIVLNELAKSELKNDFYWTGGTALAFFYLKHRLSFDIDLFSKENSVLNSLSRFFGLNVF